MGWFCGAGVFGLIGCKFLSPCFAIPTSFNNDNNNNDKSSDKRFLDSLMYGPCYHIIKDTTYKLVSMHSINAARFDKTGLLKY